MGQKVHEDPSLYNYPHKDTYKMRFKQGMTMAIEPITALRSTKYVEKKGIPFDLFTEHGDIGAQWEYTVIITNDGCEIIAGLSNI